MRKKRVKQDDEEYAYYENSLMTGSYGATAEKLGRSISPRIQGFIRDDRKLEKAPSKVARRAKKVVS